jgi:hypothetical protein
MIVRDINKVSLILATFVANELVGCLGPQSHLAVMEQFLNQGMIWPLLPSYYHKPEEAKVITNFIQSFTGELYLVKNPHSNNKLARKGALLDAMVGRGIQNIRALARILNTRPNNISCALERRDSLSTALSSRFDPLLRNKREDGILRYCYDEAVAWWSYTQELAQKRRKW